MPVSSLFSPTSHVKCFKEFVVLWPKWGMYYLGNVVNAQTRTEKHILNMENTVPS